MIAWANVDGRSRHGFLRLERARTGNEHTCRVRRTLGGRPDNVIVSSFIRLAHPPLPSHVQQPHHLTSDPISTK